MALGEGVAPTIPNARQRTMCATIRMEDWGVRLRAVTVPLRGGRSAPYGAARDASSDGTRTTRLSATGMEARRAKTRPFAGLGLRRPGGRQGSRLLPSKVSQPSWSAAFPIKNLTATAVVRADVSGEASCA